MKKTVAEHLEETEDQADLIPMIDCVLLMLMFFVVTATFSEQSAFEVALPTAATATVRDTAEATVLSISPTGGYAFGQDLVADDQLATALRQRAAQKPITTLVIQGDKGCPYEKVVIAVDAAQAVGVSELCLVVGK